MVDGCLSTEEVLTIERPNIVLILSDQHNAGILGHAGDPVVRTPHLDRLAGEGVRFSSAYCAAPLCVPSRMTFMSSRHASNIGVWSNNCVLRSDIPTFAHALGAAGYETILCGRMHFEGPDQRHGFERRIMGDFTRNYPGLPGPDVSGLPGGGLTGQRRPVVEHAGPGRTVVQAYDAAVTEAACRFIHERSPGDRPWCLVVGYYLPHCPFIAPRPLFEEYYDRVAVPVVSDEYVSRRHPAVQAWCERRGIDDLSEEEIRTARAAYYGLVTLLDQNVGRVLDAVDESVERDNTLRLYLSDHGEMAGEHGMWWKSNFYEGSVRIPMIWSWPGRFPAGDVRDEVVSLLDVGPTLSQLAGQPISRSIDGHSLLPLLNRGGQVVDSGRRPGESGGQPSDWPNEVFAEFSSGGDPPGRMIRKGPWKLIVYHGYDEPQLFNLAEDPEEQNDRAADPSCRHVRDELWTRVRAGWDPAAIAEQLRIRNEDNRLLGEWARKVGPEQEDLWKAPPGVNQFVSRSSGRPG